MSWHEKYIGIPFKENGRDFDGCDCAGLVLLALKRELNIEALDFGNLYNHEDFKRTIGRRKLAELVNEAMSEWDIVESPEPFDLVRMKVDGTNCHIGLCVNDNYFVHTTRDTSLSSSMSYSKLTRFNDIEWGNRIFEYRRYNKDKKKKTEVKEETNAHIRFIPDTLGGKFYDAKVISGSSLGSFARQLVQNSGHNFSILDKCKVCLNGIEVAYKEFENVAVLDKDVIIIHIPIMGGGGGSKMSSVLMAVVLVVAAAATYGAATWAAGAAWGSVVGPMAGATVMGVTNLSSMGVAFAYATGLAVTIAGNLALSTFSQKPRSIKQGQGEVAADSWAISGIRNKFNPYGSIALILGGVRYAPDILAYPFSYLTGQNVNARYLFGVAGHNKVSQLRIGSTNIENIQGIQYKIYEKWNGEDFKWFKNATYEDIINLPLTNSGGALIRTTAQNTVSAFIVTTYPRGMVQLIGETAGYQGAVNISYELWYSERGKNQWIPAITHNIGSLNSTLGVFGGRPNNFDRSSVGTYTCQIVYNTTNKTTRVVGRFNAGGSIDLQLGDIVISSISYTATSYFGKKYNISNENFEYFLISASLDSVGTPVASSAFSGDVSVTPTGAVSMTSGTYSTATHIETGQSISLQRRGVDITFPKAGQYDIKRVRTSGDANEQETVNPRFDGGEWSLLRSVKNEKPINYKLLNGCPMTIIEIDITSSTQYTGQLDDFNALFESYCPVYDTSSKTWKTQTSNNISNLCLMTATTGVIAEHMSMDNFDLPAFVDFQAWCEKYGWHYNGILTSPTTGGELWDRMLPGGRAIKTLNGSLIGVAFDDPDKPVVFPFGARNTANFSLKKTFNKNPIHAIRCVFLNEGKDFQEDEITVYNDGYNADNAIHIAEARNTPEGCTRADIQYKHARLSMAEMEHRNISVEFDTDHSFLSVRQFERVTVNHPVAMWGIRQVRAIDFITEKNTDDNNDYVTHIVIDDMVTVRKDKNYVLEWVQGGGNVSYYNLFVDVDTTTARLKLAMPILYSAMPLYFDALLNFGESGKASKDLILVGIMPSGVTTSKMIAHAHAPEIYKAIEGEIPSFDSKITLPDRWLKGKPNTPIVRAISSNESVLKRLGNRFIIRVLINFTVDENPEFNTKQVFCFYRKLGETEWAIATVDMPSNSIFIENVEELAVYEFRLQSLAERTSDLTPIFTHTIVGRTTPPPAPIGIFIDGSIVSWIMPDNAPIDVIGWEIYMTMDINDPFDYGLLLSNPLTVVHEFDIANWQGQARRVWVRTVDDYGLKSEPIAISINLGDVITDNIVYTLSEEYRGWPGSVTNGSVVDDNLVAFTTGEVFAFDDRFFAFDDRVYPFSARSLPMTYITSIVPPDITIPSTLKVFINTLAGRIASVEYGVSINSIFAFDDRYYAFDDRVYPFSSELTWKPMPDFLHIDNKTLIFIRVITSGEELCTIDDILFVFDTPDAQSTFNNVFIPNTGLNLMLPERMFRTIEGMICNVEYREDGTAFVAGRNIDDKGINDGYFMTHTPKIWVRDIDNIPTSGIIDVTVNGVKGV